MTNRCPHCQAEVTTEGSSCPSCGRALAAMAGTPSTDLSDIPTRALPASPVGPEEHGSTAQYGSDPRATPPLVADARPGAAPGARTGERIAGYEILGVLGRGGMGVVYKARQVALKRLVALKMVLAGEHADPDELERFKLEAEAAARLQHPNIVQIHEIGEWRAGDAGPPVPFLSLEYVDGGSLAKYLAGKPIAAEPAAGLVQTLARAIHVAHQRGIVHRDLKPANILLQIADCGLRTADSKTETDLEPTGSLVPATQSAIRNPQSAIPKITDFGLAKQLDRDSARTRTGAVMGTPCYMSPEQAAGKTRDVGPASDIYALGAILYECLTGRPPFTGANVVQTLEQVRSQEPLPPSRLQPRTPRDLETICLKCLAKEPAARYPSALALAQDLERFLAGDSILARREGPVRKLWRKVRRRPWAAAGAVAAALVLAAASYLYFSGAEARDRSRIHRRATEIQLALSEPLPPDQWNADQVRRQETLIDELESLTSSAEAAAARQELTARLEEAVKTLLQAPKIEADQAKQVEQVIALVAARDDALAGRLRNDLEQRQQKWETLFELKPPFENLEQVFDAKLLRNRSGALLSWGGTVVTRHASARSVQLDAVFPAGTVAAGGGSNWTAAASLGLAIGYQPKTQAGYRFLLDVPPNPETEKPATVSLGEALKQGGPVRQAIYRNRTLLREQPVRIEPGPLRLQASRDGDRLSFQVNQQKPLEFRDAIPLRANEGLVGVVWPREVRLERLRAARRSLPPQPSPLEQGDFLFDQGRFAEALTQYQTQELAPAAQSHGMAGRFKQALCLLELKRNDEAADLLQRLSGERGERDDPWPLLAACHLWLLHLRENRLAEADTVFDLVSSRTSAEQLARMVSEETRSAIRNSYGQYGRSLMLIRPVPNRARNLERLMQVNRLLDTVPHYWDCRALVRALRAEGRNQRAEQVIVEMLRRHGSPAELNTNGGGLPLLLEYGWLLREMGEPARALTEIDRFLFEAKGLYRSANVPLLVERARIHAALKDFDAAQKDLDDFFRLAPPETHHLHWSSACLLQGFLHERRGDPQAALEAWRKARPHEHLDSGQFLLGGVLLFALTGDMTDADADQFVERVVLQQPFPRVVREQVRAIAQSFERGFWKAVLTEGWRSPRGREWARRLALQELTSAEADRVPVLTVGFEFIKQTCLPAELPAEQEEFLWKWCSEHLARYSAGEIPLNEVQLGQLFLTWRGTTNFLGWSGVAPTLKPELRAAVAYVFGHRYLRLKQPKQAESFFRTARTDAPKDSPFRPWADAELERLGKP